MNNPENHNTKEEVNMLKPKNDIVFQSLFNKKNKRITKAFVQALLGEKIDKIVINEDKELLRENPKDKLGILDLQLDVNENEKVDVEVQLMERKDFVERLLFYFSKLYAAQLKRGQEYMEAKKVILIAIIDYNLKLTENIKEMETVWKLMERDYQNLVLTSSMEIRIIELGKVKQTYENNKEDEKAQWMLFLDNPNSVEVKEIMSKNEEIKEATVEVKKMSKDEKLQRLAYLREKAIIDEKLIYKAGEERGIEQGIKNVAKELLKDGMSIEKISKITGLDENTINELKKGL